MKRIFAFLLLAVLFFGFTGEMVFARGGYQYIDYGGIYTNTITPVDTAKTDNMNNTNVDLYDLKCGEASSRNILGLVDIGDAGIEEAAKNGGITKIMYVDTKVSKIFIPLLFIPIYIKERTTKVYGE